MSEEFHGFVTENGQLVLDFRTAFQAYTKRFAGEEVTLTIAKRRSKRSDRQNRAFWALLNTWAREEGHQVDDLKADVMGEVFGRMEVTSPLTKRVQLVPKQPHSSHLNVQDFCHLIEETLRLAAECGVVLQAPDEYRLAKEAAAKQAARKAQAA